MTPDADSAVDRHAPIFLAGTDRSGIGLVGDLLDQHPAFAVSRRTNFWTFYDGHFGDLTDPAALDRCITALMRFRRITDLGIDADRLRDTFLAGEPKDYARLFALLGEQHASSRGKPRWGDKSLHSERHADRILAAYPTGRMVQVVRDPRDRHASVTSHRGGKRGGIAGTTAEWRDSIRWAERNMAARADRYRVIRYEDLVADPAAVMGSICSFFGEPLDPACLSLPARGGDGDRVALHTRSVRRFESDLSSRQIALVEHFLQEEMPRHGYQPSEPRLGPADRVRLAAWDIPVGRMTMAARRPWSLARSRFRSGPSQRRLVE